MNNELFRKKFVESLYREYRNTFSHLEDNFILIDSCVTNLKDLNPPVENCIGKICLKLITHKKYWLVTVFVHECVRGQGKGTIMLEEIINFADENGLTLMGDVHPHLGLECIRDLKWLTQWYQGFGFEVKGDYLTPSIIRTPKIKLFNSTFIHDF